MHPSVRTQMSSGDAVGSLGWMGANAGSVVARSVPSLECHCWSSMPAHNAVSGPLWQDTAPGHRGALFRRGSSSRNKHFPAIDCAAASAANDMTPCSSSLQSSPSSPVHAVRTASKNCRDIGHGIASIVLKYNKVNETRCAGSSPTGSGNFKRSPFV